MKNIDYIQDNAFKPSTSHGNLYTDSNGTMYSYGYHYPLLFKVNGLSFVNVRGYSNTTAKHISYARPLAQFEVKFYDNGNNITPEIVKEALNREKEYLNEQIANIKRKNTKKEARLQQRVEEINTAIKALEATM